MLVFPSIRIPSNPFGSGVILSEAAPILLPVISMPELVCGFVAPRKIPTVPLSTIRFALIEAVVTPPNRTPDCPFPNASIPVTPEPITFPEISRSLTVLNAVIPLPS